MAKKKVTETKVEKYEVDPEESGTETMIILDDDTSRGGSAYLFEEDEYAWANLQRVGPATYQGKPVPMGHLERIECENIDEEYIRARYGGGKYKIQAHNEDGTYYRAKTVRIAGPPIELEVREREGKTDSTPHAGFDPRIDMLSSQLRDLQHELRNKQNSQPSALETLIKDPAGLASLIGAVAEVVRPKEDPRLMLIEKQLDRAINKQPEFSFKDFLPMMNSFTEASLEWQGKLMDARIDAIINSQSSNEWIGFAREIMHGPLGEKIAELADGINKMADERKKQAKQVNVRTETIGEPETVNSWFNDQFIFHMLKAIQEGGAPDRFAKHAVDSELVKEPFIDYLEEEWDEENDYKLEIDKIYKKIGIDKYSAELYKALSQDFVLEWVYKALQHIYLIYTEGDDGDTSSDSSDTVSVRVGDSGGSADTSGDKPDSGKTEGKAGGKKSKKGKEKGREPVGATRPSDSGDTKSDKKQE